MNVQHRIEQALRGALAPQVLQVENESASHNVPPGSETHFKVTLVSDRFSGVARVQRHRQVNQLLAELLAGPVHALALHLYAPEEWRERGAPPASPPCLGGKSVA
jgi:BolA protein